MHQILQINGSCVSEYTISILISLSNTHTHTHTGFTEHQVGEISTIHNVH